MYTLLIITHIIGTALGVGGATFAEVFYLKALKDGEIDPMEGQWLKVVYTVLRIGLILSVLSGFGLLLTYRLTGQEELLYDPKLWAKMTIIIILVVNAVLIQARKIPMWLGAALSMTSWYSALVLGSLRDFAYGYFQVLGWYLVALAVMIIVLEIVKKLYFKSS